MTEHRAPLRGATSYVIVVDEIQGWPSTDQAEVRPGEVSCPDCWLIHPEGECDR